MSELTLEVAKLAVERINEQGNYEASVYEGYVGRGMYGREGVTGIVTDAPGSVVGWAVTHAYVEVQNNDDERIFEDLDDAWAMIPRRSDNMGLSMIYY